MLPDSVYKHLSSIILPLPPRVRPAYHHGVRLHSAQPARLDPEQPRGRVRQLCNKDNFTYSLEGGNSTSIKRELRHPCTHFWGLESGLRIRIRSDPECFPWIRIRIR